jgi:hypothetical protein
MNPYYEMTDEQTRIVISWAKLSLWRMGNISTHCVVKWVFKLETDYNKVHSEIMFVVIR